MQQLPLWYLPCGDEYAEEMKSKIADLKNMGGKWGGTCNAGSFLGEFAGETKWAHLDIAGVAWKSGTHKGATGRPVGLLAQYVLDKLQDS